MKNEKFNCRNTSLLAISKEVITAIENIQRVARCPKIKHDAIFNPYKKRKSKNVDVNHKIKSLQSW